VEQSLPGMTRSERRRDLRRNEPGDRRAAPGRYQAIASPITASRAIISRRQIGPLEQAVQASGNRKDSRPGTSLIAWLPHNIPAGDETAIVPATTGSTNLVFHRGAAHTRDPRLGTLHPGASARGHFLHCMSWRIPPGQFRGIGGLDSRRWEYRASRTTSRLLPAHRTQPHR